MRCSDPKTAWQKKQELIISLNLNCVKRLISQYVVRVRYIGYTRSDQAFKAGEAG